MKGPSMNRCGPFKRQHTSFPRNKRLTTASLKWRLGVWSIQGLPLLAASPMTHWHNSATQPWTPTPRKGTGTRHTEKTSVEKNPTSLGGGREGKKMADRTQHEGKTERAKESHDRCSQPPGMRMPKTADLGTQALLVVNSFKLHLNAFKHFSSWSIIALLKGFDQWSIIINDQHTTQTNLHVFRRRDVKARPNPICRNHSRTMHNVFFGFGYSTIIWRNKQQQQQKRLSFMYTNSTPPGGTQQMFIRGDSAPRSNHLPFFMPFFFSRKRYPFRIPSIEKWCPFHIPCLEVCIPFNCTVLWIGINHKTRTFSRLCKAIQFIC